MLPASERRAASGDVIARVERSASYGWSKHCFRAKQRLRASSRVLHTTVWSAPCGGVVTCSGVGTTCDARGRRRIGRTMRFVRVEQALLRPKQVLRALSHVLHTTVGSSSYGGVVTCFPHRKDVRRPGALSCSSNDVLRTSGAGAAQGEAALRSVAMCAAFDCREHVRRVYDDMLRASQRLATSGATRRPRRNEVRQMEQSLLPDEGPPACVVRVLHTTVGSSSYGCATTCFRRRKDWRRREQRSVRRRTRSAWVEAARHPVRIPGRQSS